MNELDILARLVRERKIDRRKLFQTAAALGLSSAGAGVAMSRVQSVAAQDSNLKLVTVSQEQQPTWVRNFNPLLADQQQRWPSQGGIYEPLIIYNTIKGELTPWLAEKWAFNADNTVLTFTLRDGVKWSDGEAFDSADVKFTWDLLMKNDALPGTGGVRAAIALLSSVDAPDAKTVAFTFKTVSTPALYDIGEQMIVPEHLWKDVADPVTYTNDNPVGTGPFTDVAVFQDQYWELHKNPSYWQEGKPYIDGFRFPAYPSNDAANLASLNGENDWFANFIPDIEKTFVSKDPEHNHYWFPSTGAVVHLWLNTTIKPFDDVNVRKAISMSLDRQQMVSVAEYDYTHPADATGLSDAYAKWVDATMAGGDWVKQDADKANQMLDAAGLKKDGDWRKTTDGKTMEYEMNVVSGWSDWVSACQIMTKNLEKIGIKATVKSYDFAAWFDKVQKGDFTMTIGWSATGPTPFNFYRGAMSSMSLHPVGEISAENWHRFSAPGVDDLLNQFAATSDENQQMAIAKQLQQIYSDNAPGVPLFPGAQWGEYNSTRFTNFPDKDNAYAFLSTYENPERLITMTSIKPQS